MSGCNSVSTPIEKLGASASGKDVSNFPYRSAVGALLYLAWDTRFDIAFAIGVLSRSLEEPTIEDVCKIKCVMRYLAGTKNLCLVYKPASRVLKCFSEADFAGCNKTYRSTSGVVTVFGGAGIGWFSRRQQLVADSTREAEMIAANAASKEII